MVAADAAATRAGPGRDEAIEIMSLPDGLDFLLRALQNAAIVPLGVVAYCLLRGWLQARLSGPSERLVLGAAFGAWGALSLAMPIAIFGDVRSGLAVVLVGTATLIGGVAAGAMALVVVAGTHAVLHGPVAGLAVAVNLAVWALAAGLVRWCRRRQRAPGWRELTALALAVPLVALALALAWPGTGVRLGVLQALALPWMAVIALCTLAVGGIGLYFDRERALKVELARSRELIEQTHRVGQIGYGSTDPVSRRVRWSDSLFAMRRAARRSHLSFDEAIAFIHPDDRARYLAVRDAAFARHGSFEMEIRVLRADGTQGWERAFGRALYDDAGAIAEWHVMYQDVTERKRAEDALRASETFYRLLAEGSRDGMYDRDFTSNTLWLSERVHRILGVPDGSLSGSRELFRALVHPDDLVAHERELARLIAAREPYHPSTYRARHADGSWRWIEVRTRLVYDDDGRPLRAVGSFGDITARRTAELALAESNRRLLETERLGRIGSVVWDAASDQVHWSDSMFELRGVAKRGSFTRAESMASIHPDDRALYEAARNQAVAERRDFVCSLRSLRSDGTLIWEQIIGHPSFDDAGALAGIHLAVRDITEIREAELALRRSEERLRAIMDNAPVEIFLKDQEGRYLLANRQCAVWRGTPVADMIGRTDAELSPAMAEMSRITDEEVLKHGRTTRSERPAVCVAADVTHVEVLKFPIFGPDGTIVGLSGFAFDTTERRRAEHHLRESAKMEAIGRLASGIAHDFNNMIGAMAGFTGFLLEDLDPASPQHGYAARVALVCEHATKVVKQLLAFGRAGDVERQCVDLRELAAMDEPLLRTALAKTTRLTLDVGASPLPALVNQGQVHQILLNLCVNANDALGGRAGTVAIRLERLEPGRAEAADAAGAAGVRGGQIDPARAYAALHVSDTGAGMTQQTLDHIFEPFFTTKGPGQGSGIGLAVIQGIVAAYDGAYRVVSRLGEGSAFTIYLPLAEDAETVSREGAPALPRGTERILVVDDEPSMAEMMAIGLARFGYDVVPTIDPFDALRLFEHEPRAWAAVVTDLSMPGMSGAELAQRIKAVRPDCPVVLYTGAADQIAKLTAQQAAALDATLLKPVEPRRVADEMRALLDRRGAVGEAAGEAAAGALL